jgi:deoxyribonuclease V
MKVHHLHNWNLPPHAAVTLQDDLADRVQHNQPLDLDAITTVAGVDVSVRDNVSRAAVVVMSFPELDVIESVTASQDTPYPYVPGLLSFREGPVLVEAFEKLQQEPDVFIFDGMGRIHPRRLGIAAHMGLWLEKPTIGCGKSHLVGNYDTPATDKGAFCDLTYKHERLGVVLRTRTNVKPVYISPGHLCDIESAVALTLACTPKYRLPEPIRQAHKTAGK